MESVRCSQSLRLSARSDHVRVASLRHGRCVVWWLERPSPKTTVATSRVGSSYAPPFRSAPGALARAASWAPSRLAEADSATARLREPLGRDPLGGAVGVSHRRMQRPRPRGCGSLPATLAETLRPCSRPSAAPHPVDGAAGVSMAATMAWQAGSGSSRMRIAV